METFALQTHAFVIIHNNQLCLTDDGSVVNVGRGCRTDVNPVGCFPDDNQLVCEYHCATNLCNNNNVTVMPDMMTTAANPAQPTAVGTAFISKIAVLPLSLLLFVSRL